MKKIILFLFIISFSFSFVSCRSSWSCKKRYVETERPTQKAKAVFYRQC